MNANAPVENGGTSEQTTKSLPTELTSFAARKEARAMELAARFGAELPPVVWAFLTAAKQGDWSGIARLGDELRQLNFPPGTPKPDPSVISQVWSAVMEIHMAAAQFALGGPKYAFAFGRGIIDSIPPGSVYFAGTDPGRGLVTVLSRSHESGDPFFTLTQNALVDRPYLRYLREIYGGQLFIPSEQDLQHAWDEYVRDLERREKENQLRPGEMVERVGGRIKASNQIAVMSVNGALARLIFDRNPGREFFVEEGFPLEWMYPHLTPHGLIMALRRQPPSTISPEMVAQDQRFWNDRFGQMLGDWLRPETPVCDVCAFAGKVYLRQDLTGFTGDPSYLANDLARQAFSKLRSSIAGLYEWRARADSDPAARRRMAEAADFAFRLAFALDPHSPEAVFFGEPFSGRTPPGGRAACGRNGVQSVTRKQPSAIPGAIPRANGAQGADRAGLKSGYEMMVNRGFTPNRCAG
jgi:hypothetical protein